jgi:hypothetical protein
MRAAAIAAATVVSACGSAAMPTAPDAAPSIETLRAAPAAATLSGVRIDLQVVAYRNFIPITAVS